MLARGEVLPPAAALAQGVRMASLPAHVITSVLSGALGHPLCTSLGFGFYYTNGNEMRGVQSMRMNCPSPVNVLPVLCLAAPDKPLCSHMSTAFRSRNVKSLGVTQKIAETRRACV